MDKKEQKKTAKKKAKKVVVKELQKVVPTNIRSYLASQSYYLASIADPVSYPGSKIPDIISAPSATAQCKQRFQVIVNAGGVAAAFVQPGVIGASALQTSAAGSTSAVPTWSNLTKSFGTGLTSVCMSKRIVSASLSFEYQGPPLSRKGRAILSYDQPTTSSNNPSTSSVNTDLLIRPYTAVINLAAKPFGTVRHIPSDIYATLYSNIGNTTYIYSYLCIFLDGCTVGDVVEFTLIENYEFIPANNAVNLIQPTPSISDPIEMSVAANVVSSNPSFPVIQTGKPGDLTKAVSLTPGGSDFSVHPPDDRKHSGNEPSMIENILGGIKSSLPVVKDVVGTGVSIAKTLAPLLSI